MRPPSSRAAIAPFLAMEMAREADRRRDAGQRVVRFDVGLPYVGAPPAAIEALRADLDRQTFGYTEGLGSAALREKLSAWYKRVHGLDISPRRIAVATGASGAFLLAFLALFETGDRVALAAPAYPPYRHILTALGLTPAIVEAGPEDDFQLTPALLAELGRDKPLAGALVASPANPTGAVLSRDELAALAAAARAQGAAFISDEIYHGLVYGQKAVTALAVDDDAIVVNSFSKYWAMTGWRVGWIVAPEHLIGAIERLSQNLFIAAPTPGQVAAMAALDSDDVCEARRLIYARNRAMLLEGLPELGLPTLGRPDGAYYMLLDITRHSDDSEDFCRRALDEAGVALTTGIDFDAKRGKSWVRLAYARETTEVEEGLARLARWLD